MNNKNKHIHFFALICSLVIVSSYEVIGAAEKSVAIRAQEQCPCKKCDNKWFKSLHVNKAHPYTQQEKTFAYVWQALSQNNIVNNESRSLVPIILEYIFANYKYTPETWLEITPLQGKFYALHYPNLMLTNGKFKRIFERKVEFAQSGLSAIDSSLREPFQSKTIISRDGNFKITSSWINSETLCDAESLIERSVRLDHAERIQELIADK